MAERALVTQNGHSEGRSQRLALLIAVTLHSTDRGATMLLG